MLVFALMALVGAPIADATPTPTATPSAASGSASIGVTIGSSGSGGGSGTPIANTGGSGHRGAGGSTTAAPGSPGTATKPAVPGSPTATTNRLVLNATEFRPGQTLVAKGSGFTPGEKVQFVLYPGATAVKSFVADASGDVTATFRLSERTAIGSYTVEATGWQSARVASADYSVLSPALAGAGNVPWLIWVVGGFAVLLAVLLGCGIAFGWLPFRRAAMVPTGQLP